MLSTELLRGAFEDGLTFERYVATGTAPEQKNWNASRSRVRLTAAQQALVAGFTRRMNAVCISGLWCGDCVQQCPMFDAIAAANPDRIQLRFIDRDAHPEVSRSVRICGGGRVPVLLLLNEDFEFVSLTGDRSLSRYRALAERSLGPACPMPGAALPPDDVAATLSDWLGEFERVSLLLRLSPKLRSRHSD